MESWVKSAFQRTAEGPNAGGLQKQRSIAGTLGSFAESVAQKAGDAVERAKVAYEQAEVAVTATPSTSFKSAVTQIEDAASSFVERPAERKDALERWITALEKLASLDAQQLQDLVAEQRKKPTHLSSSYLKAVILGGKSWGGTQFFGLSKSHDHKVEDDGSVHRVGSSDDKDELYKLVVYNGSPKTSETLTFRDIFLESKALEKIVTSLIVEPGREEEWPILHKFFSLCLAASKENIDKLAASVKRMAERFPNYSETKIPGDDLLAMAADTITALKIRPKLERLKEQAQVLGKQISAETAVLTSADVSATTLASAVPPAEDKKGEPSSTENGLAEASLAQSDPADANDDGSRRAEASAPSEGGGSSKGAAGMAEESSPAAEGAAQRDGTKASAPSGGGGSSNGMAGTAEGPPPAAEGAAQKEARDRGRASKKSGSGREAEIMALGHQWVDLQRQQLSLLQQGDTPGDRLLKVERLSAVGRELQESATSAEQSIAECRRQEQEALQFQEKKAESMKNAEKALLAEWETLQERKRKLQAELDTVVAEIGNVEKQLETMTEEKVHFHLASANTVEAFTAAGAHRARLSAEHNNDAETIKEWKAFLELTWPLELESIEERQKRLREECMSAMPAIWPIAEAQLAQHLGAVRDSIADLKDRKEGLAETTRFRELLVLKGTDDGAQALAVMERLADEEEEYLVAELKAKAAAKVALQSVIEVQGWMEWYKNFATISSSDGAESKLAPLLDNIKIEARELLSIKRPPMSKDNPNLVKGGLFPRSVSSEGKN